MHRLEILRQGRVVAQVEEPSGTRRLELDTELPIDANTWLAARVLDPADRQLLHLDGWRRNQIAHTSPVYLAVGGAYELFDADVAQYMLTLIEGSLTHIRSMSHHFPHDSEQVTHAHQHHDHEAWLEEPFHQAREALHRRMHAMGIAH